MFWSLAPLILACVVLAGLAGMCSFQATGPKPGPAPEYDATAALRADAADLGIPVRLPQLPPGWHANSGGRDSIGDGRQDPATGRSERAVISTVGYLAPNGVYIGLMQSNADEPKLVAKIDSTLSSDEPFYPTGAQNIDGRSWVVYKHAGDDKKLWTTRLDGPTGPAQIALYGSASDDEFRTLATATQSQAPLPATRR
ncbi:MAG: hypothetical protein QOH60_1876 [Mycobacterium sp.]|nr:hypothetical protein [Mycobacterium sp.]